MLNIVYVSVDEEYRCRPAFIARMAAGIKNRLECIHIQTWVIYPGAWDFDHNTMSDDCLSSTVPQSSSAGGSEGVPLQRPDT